MAADFEKDNPGIKVKPIYAGSYQETIVKALTAHKSGNPPATSVLLSTDMFTLIDEDAIVPIDEFVKTDDDKKWLASMFPAFMLNSQSGGKTWGIPFQRSTVVLYWNKDLFKEAGLDPEKAPATWAEQAAFAEKLTKRDASGNTRNGASRSPRPASPIGCSRASPRRPAPSSPTRPATRPPSTRRASSRRCKYWIDLAKTSTRCTRPASSNGAPRRRTSSRRSAP